MSSSALPEAASSASSSSAGFFGPEREPSSNPYLDCLAKVIGRVAMVILAAMVGVLVGGLSGLGLAVACIKLVESVAFLVGASAVTVAGITKATLWCTVAAPAFIGGCVGVLFGRFADMSEQRDAASQ